MVTELGPTLYDFLRWWLELLVFYISPVPILFTHMYLRITAQEMPDKARLVWHFSREQ